MRQLLSEDLLQTVQAILHDSLVDRLLLRYHAKRSIEQVGLDVDRESVTNPEKQVTVVRLQWMRMECFSSAQPF